MYVLVPWGRRLRRKRQTLITFNVFFGFSRSSLGPSQGCSGEFFDLSALEWSGGPLWRFHVEFRKKRSLSTLRKAAHRAAPRSAEPFSSFVGVYPSLGLRSADRTNMWKYFAEQRGPMKPEGSQWRWPYKFRVWAISEAGSGQPGSCFLLIHSLACFFPVFVLLLCEASAYDLSIVDWRDSMSRALTLGENIDVAREARCIVYGPLLAFCQVVFPDHVWYMCKSRALYW